MTNWISGMQRGCCRKPLESAIGFARRSARWAAEAVKPLRRRQPTRPFPFQERDCCSCHAQHTTAVFRHRASSVRARMSLRLEAPVGPMKVYLQLSDNSVPKTACHEAAKRTDAPLGESCGIGNESACQSPIRIRHLAEKRANR